MPNAKNMVAMTKRLCKHYLIVYSDRIQLNRMELNHKIKIEAIFENNFKYKYGYIRDNFDV